MATLKVGDKTLELPQYKLRELRAAAPYITRAMAAGRSLASVEPGNNGDLVTAMFEGTRDILAVLAIGVLKSRSEFPYTVAKIGAAIDEIEGDIDMSQMAELNVTFSEILGEAGMVRANGNPPPPPPAVAEGTSAST